MEFRTVILVLFFSSVSLGAAAPPRVLLLQPFGRGYAPFGALTASVRADLQQKLGQPIDFDEVALQPIRFTGDPPQDLNMDYLRSKFDKNPPNLLLTIGGPAAQFALEHRSRLFPNTPMVVAGLDLRHLQNFPLTTNDTTVGVTFNIPLLIENICKILPATQHVFVVVGASPFERFWRKEVDRELQPFHDRLSFEWSDDLPFTDILKRASTLPPNSAIFYVLFSIDVQGGAHTENEALERLHEVANAPIIGAQSSQLGFGVIGGPLMSIEGVSSDVASAAARILRGESPANVRTTPRAPGPYAYDWRELQRWKVDEQLLPSGSIVKFRQATFWERNQWLAIVGISAALLEVILISALLATRTRRRAAEQSLLQSNDRLTAVRDEAGLMAKEFGRRLLHAQESERARLARELHDDITQRIARLAIDASHLDSERDQNNRTTTIREVRDELVRLSDDVHSLAYKLHPALLEKLGLANALKSECERFSKQESINVSMKLSKVPANIPQDVALCLLRVAQEALRNVARHAKADTAEIALGEANGG
jgi:signal transduction histidine kinase